MGRHGDAEATKRRTTGAEVLPPLPGWHEADDRFASLERMISIRDQRIALLELQQKEADHRIKNSLQIVAGLVSSQARAGQGIPPDRLAATVVDRMCVIARIHDLLCRGTTGTVDLADLLIELCGKTAKLLDGIAAPVIEVDTDSCILPSHSAAAMALIVHELLLNSYKHACRENRRTRIVVRLRNPSADVIRLVVQDDGGAQPPVADGSTPGIGLGLIAMIARSAGATVAGRIMADGCRFTIDMPLAGNRLMPIGPAM